MRVAVNATALLGPLTGVGQYTRQLMEKVASQPEISVRFFVGGDWADALPPLIASVRGPSFLRSAASRLPRAFELNRLVRQRSFDRGVGRTKAEIYHEPGFVPYRFEGPTVITVHDLSFIRFPQFHPANRVAFMERRVPDAIVRASIVLTDSEFIRNEVISIYGANPRKVVASLLGVSGEYRPASQRESADTLARYGLSYRGYLLTVGTFEPRKNLLQALRAYRALSGRIQSRLSLAMVGVRGWKYEELERELAGLGQSEKVRVLGYVPGTDLPHLYAGAMAFVYPSRYEGFGLPPLEAMASGVPVIASDRASLPEVVGEAGILCDPDDIEGLRDAIQRLSEDATEWHRLAEAGLLRSRQFSWDRCAAETVKAYRRALDT